MEDANGFANVINCVGFVVDLRGNPLGMGVEIVAPNKSQQQQQRLKIVSSERIRRSMLH